MMAATLLSLCLTAGASPEIGALPPLEIVKGWPSWKRIVQAKQLAEDNYAARMTDEAWKARVVWRQIWNAANEEFVEKWRRESLRELIESVGWRAVLTGELPAPIPWEK